jgi:hypothetical protein
MSPNISRSCDGEKRRMFCWSSSVMSFSISCFNKRLKY